MKIPDEIQNDRTKVRTSFSMKKSNQKIIRDKAKEWGCPQSAVLDWLIENYLSVNPDSGKEGDG